MAFQETSTAPAQVIAITTSYQLFDLNTDHPHFYFLLESDDVCYIRTGMIDAVAESADIPYAPGAYGTKWRGNHQKIAVKARSGTGTLTLAYGTET